MTNIASNSLKNVPVVILCGGRKVLLNNGSYIPRNKALVEVRGRPLFWWNLFQYALYGARDLILSTGVQADSFHDALLSLGAKKSVSDRNCYTLDILGQDCQIRLVESGEDATTAGRLLACRSYLNSAKVFALTYSDTLSDVNLSAVYDFHQKHGLVASLVGAQLPIRFRILGIRYNEIKVRAFASRPVIEAASINGGFYYFTDAICEDRFHLIKKHALENEPLEALAAAKQLAAFDYAGKWQNFDAERDLDEIASLAKVLEMRMTKTV
jgi:glucose-1-phosphate cytidylyltransferase